MMERKSYGMRDVWEVLIGNALYENYANDVDKKEKQQGDYEDRTKGAIRVAYSKEDLKTGKHHIARSFGGIHHHDTEAPYGLSHWTPNVYMSATNATEDNLRSVRVLGFDIDKKVSVETIVQAFEELDLPFRPALMIDTPKGIQFFVVFEEAFRGSARAINAAKYLGLALKEKLATKLPLDLGVSSLGCFRFPRIDTTLYFEPMHLVCPKMALEWLKENKVDVTEGRFATTGKWLDTSAGQALAKMKASKGERNECTFALSLMCYHDGLDEAQAMNVLDQWNSNLLHSLSWGELTTTIQSAYTGRYGINLDTIERLVGERPQIFTKGWYKFKKDRKERVYSHLNETEADVYTYVQTQGTEENPWVETTCRQLAEEASKEKELKKSAIQLLKQSKRFVIKEKKNEDGTIKKGRTAGFFIITKEQFNKIMKKIQEQFVKSLGKKAEKRQKNLMSKLPLFRYHGASLEVMLFAVRGKPPS